MNSNTSIYNSINPYGLETGSDFHLTRRNTTLSIIQSIQKGKEGLKLLDVGCGKGIITKYIEKNYPNLLIDAIDISDIAIEQAKGASSEINFAVADASNFKGYGYNYDIIVLNNIYEHLENPTTVLISLKSILNLNGTIIISTPNRYNTRNIIKKLFGMKILIPKHHITEYSIGQLFDHHFYSGLKIEMILTPKFKRERFRLRDFIIFNLLEPLINGYFKLLKSNTRTNTLLFVISSRQ